MAAPGTARRHHRALSVGVALSSAAVLTFEIVLSRVFAITQFHHFVFVTVSLALLGFGASGSLLTAFPELARGGPRRWAFLSALQSATTVAAYFLVNRFPFDSFSIAWDTTQIWLLVFNYVVLSLPFLAGGLVIGVLLTGVDQPHPVPSHRVYGYSLVGAGVGCVVAVGGLPWLGGVGLIGLAALTAMAGAVSFSLAVEPRSVRFIGILCALSLGLALVSLTPPSAFELRLSEYKQLNAALRVPDSEVVSTRWSMDSRVDHVRSASIRSLPGLSFTYPGNPPAQDGLTFDGDDLSPISLVAPEDADFAAYMLSSLPYLLRPQADAAVLEPRGGLEVLVAVAQQAGTVTAVEPNRLAVRAAAHTGYDIYRHPAVTRVVEEPRVFMERSDEHYDIVDLALTTPYRPVTSGAYSLAEDYVLTRQGYAAYLDHLKPDGIVAAMRWLQVPPSEETRLVALVSEAVRDVGGDPVESVVAIRGYATVLVMAKPDGFSTHEFEMITTFARERRFDLIAGPGLSVGEANQFNRLLVDEYYPLAKSLLTSEDPAATYAGHEFDINPPTDDHPFFSHFFKWSQTPEILERLGTSWQPFGGAGFFVVIAVLALATGAALILIVGPLGIAWIRRGRAAPADGSGGRTWTLAYFGLLGLGFLFVEIPIIQQYILLIGHPTTAFAVVLFALLIGSGLGSLWSRHIPWRMGAVGATLAAAAYPFLLPHLTSAGLAMPLLLRVTVATAVLFPLGIAMGTMFPSGLAFLEQRDPQLVAWAWSVNGVFSVISAAAAALLALSFGFRVVMVLGAACYAMAALMAGRSIDSERAETTTLSPRPV